MTAREDTDRVDVQQEPQDEQRRLGPGHGLLEDVDMVDDDNDLGPGVGVVGVAAQLGSSVAKVAGLLFGHVERLLDKTFCRPLKDLEHLPGV